MTYPPSPMTWGITRPPPSTCRSSRRKQRVVGTSNPGTLSFPAPACQIDPTDCTGSGSTCDPYTGYCRATNSAAFDNGAPCMTNFDCASELCITLDTGAYCVSTCTHLSGDACPMGSACTSSATSS